MAARLVAPYGSPGRASRLHQLLCGRGRCPTRIAKEVRVMGPRAFSGRDDIRAMQRLASRLWPRGWHPGGLGWALARGALADEIVLFERGGELVGWAGLGHEPDRLGHHHPGGLRGRTQHVAL